MPALLDAGLAHLPRGVGRELRGLPVAQPEAALVEEEVLGLVLLPHLLRLDCGEDRREGSRSLAPWVLHPKRPTAAGDRVEEVEARA
eukprot:175741-Alexandrium_andersonii.AAC.1